MGKTITFDTTPFTREEIIQQIDRITESIIERTTWQCIVYCMEEMVHGCPQYKERIREAMDYFVNYEEVETYRILNQIKKEAS